MWYFIKNYKTMEEVELSAYFMEYYMTEVDQTDHIATLDKITRSKILEFLCKSFFVHSEMLFESNFDGMTMEEVTTSINEAWHRATKRTDGGPRPNHNLGESMQKIKRRTDQNTASKAKRAAFDATAKPAKMEDMSKYDTGLTDFCNKHLFMSFKRSRTNEIYRLNENTWLVKRNEDLYPASVEDDLGKAHAYCQRLLDVMTKNIDESTDSIEKKCIESLKEKMTWLLSIDCCTSLRLRGLIIIPTSVPLSSQLSSSTVVPSSLSEAHPSSFPPCFPSSWGMIITSSSSGHGNVTHPPSFPLPRRVVRSSALIIPPSSFPHASSSKSCTIVPASLS
mmetsp:Transcript_18532/g.44576  ORF Transcript_18532/g.44576 Transcript_18532/m.44576 type:complete len:336 (+) Transcript_18532:565-1572(+)